ncbi:MAG: 5'-3' exonuclease H3TH domain-containing protein [Nitriliruptorales bacterium]|nr:5'-3' exonuclease H3TH domain-containing protein [Nitriliruptorales bacterium]
MTAVLAVDGNSLAHRAFHACEPDERQGAFVVGAVVRMVATAWDHGPFDAVIFGFDDSDNRRKELDADYKAHRPDHDPLLDEQLAVLPEQLAACGFTVVVHPGAEADDVMAAVATDCERAGWDCAILSSDRDLLALVSDRVRLLRPQGTFANLLVYEPGDVEAEFGVAPLQYTELAALRGDPSDGLTGVHGIGPKTAARLIRRYGSAMRLYDALHLQTPKIEAALRAGRDVVERNLLLMAPLADVTVDVEAALRAAPTPDDVDAGLLPLDQGWAAGRFRHVVTRGPREPSAPPPEEPPEDVTAVAAPAPPTVASVAGEQEALF